VASIRKTTGRRPDGWLSRYLFTEHTRRLLIEEGFTYHMDDYSDDVPFWDVVDGRAIVVVPYALDSNDMKMWVAPALTPEQWLAYAIETFDVLYDEGARRPRMMSLGVHLRIIGRPGRIRAFERLIQHVRSRPRVWIATRKEIAERWAAANPRPLS
jgi:peptidoglycan/xylan/chitin deacetylase (PgdA/CDA1 family)